MRKIFRRYCPMIQGLLPWLILQPSTRFHENRVRSSSLSCWQTNKQTAPKTNFLFFITTIFRFPSGHQVLTIVAKNINKSYNNKDNAVSRSWQNKWRDIMYMLAKVGEGMRGLVHMIAKLAWKPWSFYGSGGQISASWLWCSVLIGWTEAHVPLGSQDRGFINRVHAGRLGRHMGTIWVIGLWLGTGVLLYQRSPDSESSDS